MKNFVEMTLKEEDSVELRALGKFRTNYTGNRSNFVVMDKQVENQSGEVEDIPLDIRKVYKNYTLKEVLVELSKDFLKNNLDNPNDFYVIIEAKMEEYVPSSMTSPYPEDSLDNYKVNVTMALEF